MFGNELGVVLLYFHQWTRPCPTVKWQYSLGECGSNDRCPSGDLRRLLFSVSHTATTTTRAMVRAAASIVTSKYTVLCCRPAAAESTTTCPPYTVLVVVHDEDIDDDESRPVTVSVDDWELPRPTAQPQQCWMLYIPGRPKKWHTFQLRKYDALQTAKYHMLYCLNNSYSASA